MTSVNHPKNLCPFRDQPGWIREPSSLSPKRGPLRPSQSPFETVLRRPKGSLARLSALSHPLNWAQIALLSPSRRLKIQVA